jgi:hypothetical protein
MGGIYIEVYIELRRREPYALSLLARAGPPEEGAALTASAMSRKRGEVQQLCGLLLSPLVPAVVPGCGGRRRMARHPLDGDDVGPGIQKMANEAST